MSPLRDAAVNPVAGDFLPPVAGISPGIHANEGMHPVTPGAVSSTAATQEAAEGADMCAYQPTVHELVATPATATVITGNTQAFVATATLLDEVTAVVVTLETAWESDDEAVATVSTAGVVTPVAVGTATITATYRGSTDTVDITVISTTSIAVAPSTATKAPEATQQLVATATYSDSSTADVTTLTAWVSSDVAKATVGAATGLVTAVATGEATITGTYKTKTDTSVITVS